MRTIFLSSKKVSPTMLSEESSDQIDYQLRQREYQVASIQNIEAMILQSQFHLPEIWKQWRCCVDKNLPITVQQLLREKSLTLIEELFQQMNEQINQTGYNFTELYENNKQELYIAVNNIKQNNTNLGLINWLFTNNELLTQLIWAQCRDFFIKQYIQYADYIKGYLMLYLFSLEINELQRLNQVTGQIISNICSVITPVEIEEINEILQFIRLNNLSIKNIKQFLKILYTLESTCDKSNYSCIYHDIINQFNGISLLKKLLKIVTAPKMLKMQLELGIKVINIAFNQQHIIQLKHYCSLTLQTLDMLLEEYNQNPAPFQNLNILQIIGKLLQICNIKGEEELVVSGLLILEQFIILFELQDDVLAAIFQQTLKTLRSNNRDIRDNAINLINSILISQYQNNYENDIQQTDLDLIYSEYKVQQETNSKSPDQLQAVRELLRQNYIEVAE